MSLRCRSVARTMCVVSKGRSSGGKASAANVISFGPPKDNRHLFSDANFFLLTCTTPPSFAGDRLVRTCAPIGVSARTFGLTSFYSFSTYRNNISDCSVPLSPANNLDTGLLGVASPGPSSVGDDYLLVLSNFYRVGRIGVNGGGLIVSPLTRPVACRVGETASDPYLLLDLSFLSDWHGFLTIFVTMGRVFLSVGERTTFNRPGWGSQRRSWPLSELVH